MEPMECFHFPPAMGVAAEQHQTPISAILSALRTPAYQQYRQHAYTGIQLQKHTLTHTHKHVQIYAH